MATLFQINSLITLALFSWWQALLSQEFSVPFLLLKRKPLEVDGSEVSTYSSGVTHKNSLKDQYQSQVEAAKKAEADYKAYRQSEFEQEPLHTQIVENGETFELKIAPVVHRYSYKKWVGSGYAFSTGMGSLFGTLMGGSMGFAFFESWWAAGIMALAFSLVLIYALFKMWMKDHMTDPVHVLVQEKYLKDVKTDRVWPVKNVFINLSRESRTFELSVVENPNRPDGYPPHWENHARTSYVGAKDFVVIKEFAKKAHIQVKER